MDTKFKHRVTGCIADRFAVMYATDMGAETSGAENFAHNAALALDFIGAGKIASGEAYDLLLRALNNEFKNEDEILEYISHIRAERKPRQTSLATKKKNDAKILLKRGYTTTQVAAFLEMAESDVIEIAQSLNK